MLSVYAVPKGSSVLGDRYEILGAIGEGAAANVFRVRDARTGAIRAAKVLKTDRAASAETVARFEDEFRILRTLHHPHLPEVHDYGFTADGGRYLVMEMVDGVPLHEYFRNHPEDIWVILYELCETLVFLHARNLLHQDIKPSNILVARVASAAGERPLVKLIDFGLTFQRGTGAAVRLVGTAEYVAPEVVRGEKSLTRAVDYYSLGATLFELLTGAPPFRGTESEMLRAHLEREPFIEEEELEWAELYPHVRALLAKDAQTRLAAFEEFRRAVVGRLTGGIEDLDRSYALARIDSLGTVGKKDAWDDLLGWLKAIATRESAAHTASVSGTEAPAHTLSISGAGGVGKRFLADALRAEASLRGVRTLTPSEVTLVRADAAVARQPALMWSRLLEICEKEPVILVVETPHSLPDEERSFVRLAGTQWELSRSRGRVLPLFFLIAVDSTTDDADILDYLPSESALAIELAHLTDHERDEIVAQFRGSMFDARDARALSTYLGRFEDTGSAIQGLQQAVLRSGLTFVGQRWKVQPSLLTEIVKTGRSGAFSQDLVASLTDVERRIAAIVAAHPEPVSAAWVAEFAGIAEHALHSIIGGSLKRLLGPSSQALSPATVAIREALREGGDADQIREAHQYLAIKLAESDSTISGARALAHHYEQLGRVRDAARVHLRLLQTYWSTRPRERPYELIEGVCRSGLELLATHGRSVTDLTRRHLFCFYLKEWIKALWARNLFTHAKPIIDEWTTRLGEKMPASVAPRYVRSVLELEGPEAALASLTRIRDQSGKSSAQLFLRLELERALAMHALGDFAGALTALDAIADGHLLSRRDQHRVVVYHSMNFEELFGFGASVERLSSSLVDNVYKDGFVDEALLMLAIRARAAVAKGRIEETISEAARGLSISRKAGLNLRAHFFYRIAGTAYVDSNNVRRAQACLQRAVQLAGSLGMRYLTATGWARLAERECELGRLGNARSCSNRALEMMNVDAQVRDINQARITAYAVDVLKRQAVGNIDISGLLVSPIAPNERGQFHLWQGRDLFLRGEVSNGMESFRRARQSFQEVGIQINVASAMLQEARGCLLLHDRDRFEELLSEARALVDRDAPALSRFDFMIVELSGNYLFRNDSEAALALAQECERFTVADANISMRIELLQAMFRVFARKSRTDDALRVFDRYRALVSEVVANAGLESGSAVAEAFGVTAMIEEYRSLAERFSEAGDPAWVPLRGS